MCRVGHPVLQPVRLWGHFFLVVSCETGLLSLVSMAASTRQRPLAAHGRGCPLCAAPVCRAAVWFHMGPRRGKSVRSLGERPWCLLRACVPRLAGFAPALQVAPQRESTAPGHSGAALRSIMTGKLAPCFAGARVWHNDEVTEQRSRQPARRAVASMFLWPTIGVPPPIISEAAGFDSPLGRADYLIKML